MEPCPLDVSDLQYLFEANVYRLIDFVFFLDLTTRINKNEHNIKQILLDYTHENNDEEW